MSSNTGRRSLCRVIDGLPLEANAEIEPGDFVVKHKTTGLVRAGEAGIGSDYFLIGESTQYASAKGKAAGEVVVCVNQGDLLVDWADGVAPAPDGTNLGNMMYVAGRRLITTDSTNNPSAGKLLDVESNTSPTLKYKNKPVISVVTV